MVEMNAKDKGSVHRVKKAYIILFLVLFGGISFLTGCIKEPEGVNEERAIIPFELKEELKEVLLLEREIIQEKMASMVSDRVLSEGDLDKLAKENVDIYERLAEIEEYEGSGIWVAVDADNDGIEDVFLQQYLGGSAGFTDYFLFQGNKKGIYVETDSWSSIKEEWAFIEWDGKNYFSRTTYDYNQKIYNGLGLIAFKDGKQADEVKLEIAKVDSGNKYTTSIEYMQDEKFEYLANNLMNKFDINSVDFSMESELLKGTAEIRYKREKESDLWSSDYNNDGSIEEYNKDIFQTTNMSTLSRVMFQPKDKEDAKLFYELMEESGENTVQMWVDETEYGNIIYMVDVASLHDFRIKAYLMKQEEVSLLFQILYEFELEIDEVSQVFANEELLQVFEDNQTEFELVLKEICSKNESLPFIVYNYSHERKDFDLLDGFFEKYPIERIAMNDSPNGIYVKFSFDTDNTKYDYWGIYYSVNNEAVMWGKDDYEENNGVYSQKGSYYEYETEKIKDNWYYYQCVAR